jgi:5-methyltetrahydrofolate--homocysteine methyltransferase
MPGQEKMLAACRDGALQTPELRDNGPVKSLLDALDEGGTLLADGATGTWMQERGLQAGAAPEQWTLERPGMVRQLASEYASAGSDLVYSNTFGGNRIRLGLSKLADHIQAVNADAVRLAREGIAAAGSRAWVAGSVGPTGEMIEPYGDIDPDDARAAFLEQAVILVGAGVDALVCETFTAIEEALLAVGAAREASDGKLPVFASMAFDPCGRTMMGVTPADAVAALSGAGARIVGANCGVGPDVVASVLAAMRKAAPACPLLGKPNAGLPISVDGKTVYPASPDTLAAFASEMRAAGTALVGACCGSTPAHLRAMRAALDA